jgi:hypothetical protein
MWVSSFPVRDEPVASAKGHGSEEGRIRTPNPVTYGQKWNMGRNRSLDESCSSQETSQRESDGNS